MMYKIERSIDHAYSLLQSLNRDRKKGLLCDVTIVVGAKSYLVHRYVLAASSDYFRDLLCEDEKFSLVTIEDALPETVEQCIEYIYTGTVDVTDDNILPLWDLCMKLQLTKIASKCAEYLVTSMNGKQCLFARELAIKHSHDELKEAADEFGRENLDKISTEKEFLELDRNDLRFFLDSPKNDDYPPAVLYDAIIGWIYHGYNSRSDEFPNLLPYIKMSLFSSKFLLETVRKEPLFCLFEESRSLLELEMFSRTLTNEASPAIVLFDSLACSTTAYNVTTRKKCKMRLLEAEMYESCTALCLDEFIYVLKSDKVFRLNCRSRMAIWTRVADLHQKRLSKIEAGVHKHYLYVVGGKVQPEGSESDPAVSSFGEYHHPARDMWFAMRKMPTLRYGHAVVGCGDFLYCIGGRGEQGAILDTVEKFDPRISSWNLGNSPMNIPRADAMAVSHCGQIYVLGGEVEPGEITNSVEYYDPHANTWTITTRMMSSRSNFSAGILKNRLYVIGGAEGKEDESEVSVEVMDLDTNTWSLSGTIKGIGKLQAAVLRVMAH